MPVGVAMLWLLRSRGTGGRPWAAVLRCLSLALIVLALAQPQVGHSSGGPVTLALDRSLSIGPGESHTERAWLKAASGEECGGGCAGRAVRRRAEADRELDRPAAGLPPPAPWKAARRTCRAPSVWRWPGPRPAGGSCS